MSNIIITAVVGKDFQAPETIEVDGHKLPLLDKAFAIGINGENKVVFQGEKSGEKRPLDVSEKTFKHVLHQTVSCRIIGCPNKIMKGGKCWTDGHL